MSFIFVGPNGSVEHSWIAYALLRDNVQHHLEGGHRSADFEQLHRIADATRSREVSLPAPRLHAEFVRAREGLRGRSRAELAISLRTRSVISLAWPPPDENETVLVSESEGGLVPWLPEGQELLDLFGHLVDDLVRITEGASEGAKLEVHDA
jgi:hypothetical protein